MAVAKRQRQNAFLVRLNDKELMMLEQRVKKTGLSRETFIRKLVKEEPVHELLPIDYHKMKEEIRKIGRNINQIARIANETGMIDHRVYLMQMEALHELLEVIDTKIIVKKNRKGK